MNTNTLEKETSVLIRVILRLKTKGNILSLVLPSVKVWSRESNGAENKAGAHHRPEKNDNSSSQ
jgi:hypothetical protein